MYGANVLRVAAASIRIQINPSRAALPCTSSIWIRPVAKDQSSSNLEVLTLEGSYLLYMDHHCKSWASSETRHSTEPPASC